MSVRATLMAIACTLSFTAHAMADAARKVAIPAGDLRQALLELSKEYGAELLYRPEDLKAYHTGGVRGTYTAPDAVRLLLKGTPLELRVDASGAMAIVPVSTSANTSKPLAPPAVQEEKEGKSNSSGTFRLAQTTAEPASGAVAPTAQTPAILQEVVVTAQKRAQRLQDVPVPVSVIGAQALTDNNLLRLQDYYTQIPGFSVTPSAQSNQVLAIRGITTGTGTNPTVGVTVDDVPFGSSTNLGGGTIIPDFDPGDLARVEVLRGPQGTLYGASSMGGLVKFVTVDPSTSGTDGRMQVGVDGVHNGSDAGYNVRGSVNVPLSDTWAVRASGFYRHDPGYIDDPTLPADGVNSDHADGGHLAALWRPSDTLSLKLTALYQEIVGDGSNDVDHLPGLGDLQQSYLRGTGGYDRRHQLYSATFDDRIGAAELTSVTGYNVNAYSDSSDYGYKGLGGLAQKAFGVSGTPLFDDNRTNKVTQELRLAMPWGHWADWLVGFFYTHESSHYTESVAASDPITTQIAGTLILVSFPTTYTEYAGFTDLTLHLTARFDLQIGGRESHLSQSFTQTETGGLLGGAVLLTPEADIDANAFTYLVTPTFRINPDLMVYARVASGYRAGGSNATDPQAPPQYAPDKTDNYELGTKADLLSHALSIDASLYYIDWQNLQIQLQDPVSGFGYNANGGRARSKGLELAVTAHPLTGLSLSGWVVWNDAQLVDSFPASSTAYGVSGDRLPFSSRFSGNLSLQEDFPLTGRLRGFAGASETYVGSRESVFLPLSAAGAVQPREVFPAYARTDLRAGAHFDDWTVTVYANNLTDRRGLLNGGAGAFPPFAFTYIQPRTIGLTLARDF